MDQIEILSANLNGCSHNIDNPKFDYGIKKCFTNSGSNSSVILMTETMSDGDLRIEDNHSTFIIPGDRPGTGMCASINVEKLENYGKVKVESLANKIQFITLAGILNIISIYAPQVGSDDHVKNEYKKNLEKALKEIDKDNDLPIVCVGDYNIPKAEIGNSYLKDIIENGDIYGSNQATQKFGNELDYCCVFKGSDLDIEVKNLQNATSDHEAIHLKIKNLNNIQAISEQDQQKAQKMKKPIPIPKSQKSKDTFKFNCQLKWNHYLSNNISLKRFLQQTDTAKILCKCKKGNHRTLLSEAYHNMRQIIIEVAEKQIDNKKKKKTYQPPKCHSSVFEKLYAKFLGKQLSKERFRKILKRQVEKYSQKIYIKMSKVIKSSKKFYNLLKIRTTGKGTNQRQPKIPIKKVFNLYKEIYEPENFSKLDVLNFKKKFRKKGDDSLDYVKFSDEEFFEAMDGVKRKKSSRGPKIELWEYSGLGKELLKIFNGCLLHGYIPEQLLTADIKLLKKDHTITDRDEKNYRPIALVESASKILELMMKKRINWEFSKNQYAYQPKIGCLNAIKDFLLTAFNMRSEGISYSIFLDLSKAFDKLDFNAIMRELHGRMDYQMRRIFLEYLTNTSTNLENYKIFPRRGIRQGGLLSPLIFLQTTDPWLRNYNKNDGQGRVQGYADDTAIQTPHVQWGQKCLDSFDEFADKNGLQINPKKCKVVAHLNFKEYMFYSIKGRKLPTFYIKGQPLEYVREYKYLGYWITSCLTGNYQLNEIFRKVKQTILRYKRFFRKCPIRVLVHVARSHVSSKLYGLEFIKDITQNQITRFNYFYNIWFGCKTESTNNKLEKYHYLQLKELHEKAAQRYENIESRLQ